MADLTAQQIFNEKLPNKLEESGGVDIDAIYQFNVTGDDGGTWNIDFDRDGDYVQEGENEDADCVVEIADSDFVGMWNGDLNGQQLFMMGKISVEGDMGLALKLQKFIG